MSKNSNKNKQSNPTKTNEGTVHESALLLKLESMFDRNLSNFSDNIESKIEGKLKNFENTIAVMRETVEGVLLFNKKSQIEINILKSKFDVIEKENKDLKLRLLQLETHVHGSDQAANNYKIEIVGVPAHADCDVYVQQVLQEVNEGNIIQKEEFEIEKNIKQDHLKSLTIKFKNIKTREAIMTNVRKERRKLNTKDISQQYPAQNIYINEFLNPYFKRVFYEAKLLKKEKKFNHLWIRNGQILIKKNDDSKTMNIKNLDDLSKL